MPVSKAHTITLTPCGGGREIGANSYLLGLEGCDVLLDCGIHPKKEGWPALPDLSLLRRAPDAVLISHGHIDHCGALPYLLKQFPLTTPFSTQPTVSIMDRMLHNSVAVMVAVGRERCVSEYPLYDHEDVDYAVQSLNGMPLDEDFLLGDEGGISARFRHAGHVLGSASVYLRSEGHSVYYTGDICAADQELMAGLAYPEESLHVDTLIIESTYGANGEADKARFEEQIAKFALRADTVLNRGGVVLVPSFALGRTQEMLNIIARLQDCGTIPDVPVYASGLGRAIYEVYNRFPEYLHPNAILRPLKRFSRVGDVWNRDVVLDLLSEPGIIVATSGMMVENTPSALIAEEMVRHKKHGIFFVGYLDPDTLGYRLLHGGTGANLSFGIDRLPVKVKLEDIGWFHFSAHAPREALRDIVERVRPKNVVYVHGDPAAVDWMYETCGNGCQRYTASVGQTLTLEA